MIRVFSGFRLFFQSEEDAEVAKNAGVWVGRKKSSHFQRLFEARALRENLQKLENIHHIKPLMWVLRFRSYSNYSILRKMCSKCQSKNNKIVSSTTEYLILIRYNLLTSQAIVCFDFSQYNAGLRREPVTFCWNNMTMNQQTMGSARTSDVTLIVQAHNLTTRDPSRLW